MTFHVCKVKDANMLNALITVQVQYNIGSAYRHAFSTSHCVMNAIFFIRPQSEDEVSNSTVDHLISSNM